MSFINDSYGISHPQFYIIRKLGSSISVKLISTLSEEKYYFVVLIKLKTS